MGVSTWREALPRAGAFSPGLPSPQSEASCLSYTEKVRFRVTGQRSHSHEGVGQGLNPLGILAPPRSERRVREGGARAMAVPGEPHPLALCVQRFSVSPDVREEERARSVAVLCLRGQSRAFAEGSRLHDLALKETVVVTPVSAGLVPVSRQPRSQWEAQGQTLASRLCLSCCVTFVSFPLWLPSSHEVGDRLRVAGVLTWGKAAFLGDRMQETRGPDHSFPGKRTQF